MSTQPSADTAVVQTRKWLEQLVLGQNLCPFAHKPYKAGLVRFVVSPATRPGALLEDFMQEVRHLQAVQPSEVETTLLIHPHVLDDFHEYNDFLDTVEELLWVSGLEGVFQVASFHPNYQFSGTAPDDAENYTNRSPWPMLHILREDSIGQALSAYPDAEQVPERNIETMNRLGSAALQQLLVGVKA